MNAPSTKQYYVSVLRYSWLTSLYDPVMQMFMRENKSILALVEKAEIALDHPNRAKELKSKRYRPGWR